MLYAEHRKLAFEPLAVSPENHPGQSLVGVQHSVAGREAPALPFVVVHFWVDFRKEEAGEGRMSAVHNGNDAAWNQDAVSLSKEPEHIPDVMEHMCQEERAHRTLAG